jgi:hypothetical protein
MNHEKMLKPAVTGGVLLGILSAIPVINFFNCFCCAWIIGGGVLAAYMYVKDSPVPVSLGSGVLLGLLTGVIGGIVNAVFSVPLHFLLSGGSMGFVEQIRDALDRLPNIPPETRDAFQVLAERGSADVLFWIFNLLFWIVISCLFAMVGGAIGVAVFEKRKTDGLPMDATSYQPPTTRPPEPPDTPQQ